MNIAESFIRKIEKDGIILTDRKDVYNSIDTAIQEGGFFFLNKDGINIGFFTWHFLTPKEVLITNLFVDRKYRGTFKLMWIIRFLRAKYKEIGAFSWRNRKKNKQIRFKEKEKLCY